MAGSTGETDLPTAALPAVDLEIARAHLRTLMRAQTFEVAEQALDRLAETIAMPRMAWSPDVGCPHFNAHMDGFLRRHNWPEDILTLWWDQHVMLKMPVYIRCRYEHLPFVSEVRPVRGSRSALSRITTCMVQAGMHSLLTVPIIMPRGRIAMLTWTSDRPAEFARGVLDVASAELFVAGHAFMRAYARQFENEAPAHEDHSLLTPREWDCLRLVAQGYRDAEIGRLIELAPTTVRFHLENVTRKLGATNRTHAVALAAQRGMLGPIGN